MEWYFILWIVLGIIVALGAATLVGYHAEELDEDPATVVLLVILTIVLLPAVLGIVLFSAPLIGLYALGKYLRNKKTSKA